MAPRTGIAPPRGIDFSAVGKSGRRTGVTLPQQRLDEHGLEEMSHLFSSPKKPSPLKNYILADTTQEELSHITPKQVLPARKTLRASIPRSASPRKSGISGTARRSNGIGIRGFSKDAGAVDLDDHENVPITSPTRANNAARRFSPSLEKTPLRDITIKNAPALRYNLAHEAEEEDNIVESVEHSYQPEEVATPEAIIPISAPYEENDYGPVMSDGEDDVPGENEDDGEEVIDGLTEPLPQLLDDEEVDRSFAPEPPAFMKNLPNSRRKRKSDLGIPDTSPAPKRAKRTSPMQRSKSRQRQSEEPEVWASRQAPSDQKSRQPPRSKNVNSKMSARQEEELNGVIERVKSRPGPPKSLYVLRRETPADDSVTHTRSGRVSFKPLAFWRNERCVWGSSPSNATIKEGARFPLNSIKEIIRSEDVTEADAWPKRKGRKGKKAASRSRLKTTERAMESSDSESEEDRVDPDAEKWETKVGTFRGPVAVWDSEMQNPVEEEEEIDIAYAPAAIETTEVKNVSQSQAGQPSFKYAKLLGNKFMGVGLVDLPPGGVKRPKNSRKMHMSFYVVKGRVTVHVGAIGGEMNRFSIGKGGFWQVPRGNQYSIENQLEKPARIFFSQGCEVEVGLVED